MLRYAHSVEQQKVEGAQSFELLTSLDAQAQEEAIALQKRLIAEMFPDNPIQTVDYDVNSEYFAVKKEGKVVGCGRLIFCDPKNPANSFQVDEYPEKLLDIDFNHIPKNKTAEMSAFYILKEHQGTGGVLALMKAGLALCHQRGITHLFSMMDPKLAVKYQETYGVSLTPICEPFDVTYDKTGKVIEAIYFDEIHRLINRNPSARLREYLNPIAMANDCKTRARL
jgi:hypothetical protein